MKKIIGAVLAISMLPAIASAADQTIRLDPLSLSYGGIGFSYQYNRDKDSAWTFDYASYEQSYAGTKVSAGIIGGAYKKAFSGNVIGSGPFWRAGLAQVKVGATDSFGQAYSLAAIFPVLTAGYDYKIDNHWVLTGEVGIASISYFQVGYTF